MMPQKFPTIRKEWSKTIYAAHDLTGVTTHPDAAVGQHMHEWAITLVWIAEYNCRIGFQRDEHSIAESWGGRIDELNRKNLSELMVLPATAENFACFLLFYWLPRLTPKEINHELTAVRVTKDGHSCEVAHTEANKRGWQWFGGPVV